MIKRMWIMDENGPTFTNRRVSTLMKRYLKMRKRLTRLPGRLRAPLRGQRTPMSFKYAIWSFVSGTLGILAIFEITDLIGYPLLIGSFCASAVLLFGATDSALSQPRNLVGGHIVSAVTAVLMVAAFGSTPLSIAFGVG